MRLSEQIRPWDTLACCWDINQATNEQRLKYAGVLAHLTSAGHGSPQSMCVKRVYSWYQIKAS